ncbi:MAG TPA: hypothetical protein PLY45_03095 [bacterium]|nr:hypothetical protein [bacterium]
MAGECKIGSKGASQSCDELVFDPEVFKDMSIICNDRDYSLTDYSLKVKDGKNIWLYEGKRNFAAGSCIAKMLYGIEKIISSLGGATKGEAGKGAQKEEEELPAEGQKKGSAPSVYVFEKKVKESAQGGCSANPAMLKALAKSAVKRKVVKDACGCFNADAFQLLDDQKITIDKKVDDSACVAGQGRMTATIEIKAGTEIPCDCQVSKKGK